MKQSNNTTSTTKANITTAKADARRAEKYTVEALATARGISTAEAAAALATLEAEAAEACREYAEAVKAEKAAESGAEKKHARHAVNTAARRMEAARGAYDAEDVKAARAYGAYMVRKAAEEKAPHRDAEAIAAERAAAIKARTAATAEAVLQYRGLMEKRTAEAEAAYTRAVEELARRMEEAEAAEAEAAAMERAAAFVDAEVLEAMRAEAVRKAAEDRTRAAEAMEAAYTPFARLPHFSEIAAATFAVYMVAKIAYNTSNAPRRKAQEKAAADYKEAKARKDADGMQDALNRGAEAAEKDARKSGGSIGAESTLNTLYTAARCMLARMNTAVMATEAARKARHAMRTADADAMAEARTAYAEAAAAEEKATAAIYDAAAFDGSGTAFELLSAAVIAIHSRVMESNGAKVYDTARVFIDADAYFKNGWYKAAAKAANGALYAARKVSVKEDALSVVMEAKAEARKAEADESAEAALELIVIVESMKARLSNTEARFLKLRLSGYSIEQAAARMGKQSRTGYKYQAAVMDAYAAERYESGAARRAEIEYMMERAARDNTAEAEAIAEKYNLTMEEAEEIAARRAEKRAMRKAAKAAAKA